MPNPGALGPPITAEPFVAWLHVQMDLLYRDDTIRSSSNGVLPANQTLATRLGISVRCLHHYLHSRNGSGRQTDTYGRWRIEDLLEHAGVMLADVYPDLPDHDIVLEPDAFCATCAQTVTPIEGICPWCESRPVPLLQAAA